MWGVTYSFHQIGQAVDLALPSNKEKREKFIKLAKRYFPVARVYEDKNFIHCDVGEKRTW